MLFRETFSVGAFASNCTILGCDKSKEALVIDPGGDAPRISTVLGDNSLTVKAIVLTHAHIDHIQDARAVKEAHGGDICLHADDLFLYDGVEAQGAMFGMRVQSTLPVDHYLEDDEKITFGDFSAQIIHTPGHTPGGVCLEIQDGDTCLIISGDTLFRRGIGRTDLPGGNTEQLLTSIKTRLYTRAPDAIVVPGHGPNTTIGEEAAKNPFVNARIG